MGLLDRLLGRSVEQTAPKPKLRDPQDTPAGEPVGFGNEIFPMSAADRQNGPALIAAALRSPSASGRAARYQAFDQMDTADVAAILDATTGACLTFENTVEGRGWKLESDNPNAEKLLRAAIAQAELMQLAEELLRDLLKYGDCFCEPVFVKQQLVAVQTYRPAEIFVAKNDKGRLSLGVDDNKFPTAYQQKRNGQVVAGWYPHELVHGKLFPSRKLLYSQKSMLDDLRTDWRKLQLVEFGMVVARVSRAYPRRVHMLDMTGKDRGDQERTLIGYINRMTGRTLGKAPVNDDGLPTASTNEDLYVATGYTTGADGKPVPRLNSVKTEDPSIAGLAELGDVQYLRQKLYSLVPADTAGIANSGGGNSGESNSQDAAYARFIRKAQRQLELVLRGVLDQVLLANGLLPVEVSYRIVFPVVAIGSNWRNADAKFRQSLTLRNYAELGAISRRYALKSAFNLSDREIDAEWEQIALEATNPIFQAQIAPARNGAPSLGGQVTGAIGKSLPGGSAPVPTAADTSVIPATGADPSKASTTKNGISRGSKLGQRLRGSQSGG